MVFSKYSYRHITEMHDEMRNFLAGNHVFLISLALFQIFHFLYKRQIQHLFRLSITITTATIGMLSSPHVATNLLDFLVLSSMERFIKISKQ